MDPSTRSTLRATGLLLAGLPLLATACVGTAPSPSSWRDSTDRTIGAATSSVGTAQIVLDAAARGHLTRSYAVVALTDAIATSRREVDSFATTQPPEALHELSSRVQSELETALRLLTEIRTAYAADGFSASQAKVLSSRAKAELDALDVLSTRVTGDPS